MGGSPPGDSIILLRQYLIRLESVTSHWLDDEVGKADQTACDHCSTASMHDMAHLCITTLLHGPGRLRGLQPLQASAGIAATAAGHRSPPTPGN